MVAKGVPISARVAALAGAHSATPGAHIQSLWSGYGEVRRYALDEGRSVVVKHVRPPQDSGRSHARKLRSYEVEAAWYRDWAPRCADARVPVCHGVEEAAGEWLFVLEDLDAAGFSGRGHLSERRSRLVLRWLAAFHASFLGEHPRGLWATGTYWHLETRPDELRAMKPGPLREAAAAIDARLRAARFQTLVHGDAKAANFCFAPDEASVAAVDFQYVGGGCGMKDVAYLLAGERAEDARRLLDTYFRALREHLPPEVDGAALEAEWRALYPWAWADFERFLSGWSPGWGIGPHGRSMTRQVLSELR